MYGITLRIAVDVMMRFVEKTS